MSARKSEPAPVGRAESSRNQLRVALILSMKEIMTAMGQRSPTSWYKESPNLVLTFEASHDYCTRSKGLIWAATAGLLVLTMFPGLAQTKKLGDGLTFEGAGASFIGSGQTTTLNCAGGGAHILGSNNTLTLTGACKWLDMVGSNNT